VIAEIPLACADEKAAVEFMEKQRWGSREDVHCPRCGDFNVHQMMNKAGTERQANYRWLCKGCKEQFTFRIGTVLEDSRIPARHWCYAFWRAATSKKGVSALEIHRHTGISYKSSLFLLNRIRCAMKETPVTPLSGTIEADEVFIGGKPRISPSGKVRGQREKWPVLGMLERGGRVRTQPLATVNGDTLRETLAANVDFANSRLMTDELSGYRAVGREFKRGHKTVVHTRNEYSREGGDVTTNHIEGFFSLVRRSLDGIYHAVSKEHLPKYLAEMEFRYTHRHMRDGERTVHAIKSAIGKHLTYEASKA